MYIHVHILVQPHSPSVHDPQSDVTYHLAVEREHGTLRRHRRVAGAGLAEDEAGAVIAAVSVDHCNTAAAQRRNTQHSAWVNAGYSSKSASS